MSDYDEIVAKRIGFVLPNDGYTQDARDIEDKARQAQFASGLEIYNCFFIPAGLTRLHLLALCSLTHLPIYMGNCHGQPFNAYNQCYEHTLNGQYEPRLTERGIIEVITELRADEYWTEDNQQMMTVEEALYVIFFSRCDYYSTEENWAPKDKNIVINCRGGEALVYYAGTGWEIKDYIDGEKGLERKFIPLE